MLIYVIRNKHNGKPYVGQTQRTLEERIYEHRHGKTLYIDRAIRKIGWENFTVEVIEVCSTLEELNEREIYWICKLNSKKPNGYNMTDGGSNTIGWHHSEETKKRISKKKKAQNKGKGNPMYGRRHTAKSRKQISLSKTGKHHTAVTRAKMSANNSGEKNPNYGRKHTAEERAKMSSANSGERNVHRGKHLSERTKLKIGRANSKAVRCVETGRIFNSITEAAKELGIDRAHISDACKGKRSTVGGFHWEYVQTAGHD